MCKDKPQKCMLHFLGGLNRKSQDPTSQPEKCMLHFWGVWCIPKYVQICANIGIGIKHNISIIYQNDSECRMGMNGEDMVG